MAAFAPIPSPNVAITVAANAGDRRRPRKAYRTSSQMFSRVAIGGTWEGRVSGIDTRSNGLVGGAPQCFFGGQTPVYIVSARVRRQVSCVVMMNCDSDPQ